MAAAFADADDRLRGLQAAAERFLTPLRQQPPEWRLPPRSDCFTLRSPAELGQGDAVEVAHHRWGEGAPVLLVHGWQSESSTWSPWVPPLLAAGYAVHALDLPGHGRSGGWRLSLPLAEAAIAAVAERAGPLAGAVGHSFGAAALAGAVAARSSVRWATPATALVLLASPSDYAAQMQRQALGAGVPPSDWPLLQHLLGQRIGAGLDRFRLTEQAPHAGQRTLWVHAEEDPVAPAAGASAAAARWPASQWLSASGLGHFRLLRDESIIAAALRFISTP